MQTACHLQCFASMYFVLQIHIDFVPGFFSRLGAAQNIIHRYLERYLQSDCDKPTLTLYKIPLV